MDESAVLEAVADWGPVDILVANAAKGLLPYHGLGSGITRALEAWPQIDFKNDYDGCLFTATVHRRPLEGSEKTSAIEAISPNSSEKSSVKSSEKPEVRLLTLLKDHPTMTISELAVALEISTRAVEKRLARLRSEGRLRRIGPDRGGRWEVQG
jgi:ATP-dependent DNA helicase RecG